MKKKMLIAVLMLSLLTGCKSADNKIVKTVPTEIENSYIMPVVYSELQGTSEIKWKKDRNGKLYPYSYSVAENKKLYETIYYALYERAEQIELDSDDIEDGIAMLRAMCVDNPDFYYVDLTSLQATETGIYLSYSYTAEQCAEWQTVIDRAVAVVQKNMPTDISDYAKYVYLHDFIALNMEYQENPYQNSIVGAFSNRLGACRGYASAYFYLCREFDLPCAPETGYLDEYHLYNAMNIGEDWVAVDVTSDDLGVDVSHLYIGNTTYLRSISAADTNYIHIPKLSKDNAYVMQGECLVLGSKTQRTEVLPKIMKYCEEQKAKGAKTVEIYCTNSILRNYISVNMLREEGELRDNFIEAVGDNYTVTDTAETIIVKLG